MYICILIQCASLYNIVFSSISNRQNFNLLQTRPILELDINPQLVHLPHYRYLVDFSLDCLNGVLLLQDIISTSVAPSSLFMPYSYIQFHILTLH